jgi:hypothetical protein
VRVAPQLGVDRLKNAFDVFEDVVVPEPDDTVSNALQVRVAPLVIVLMLCVLAAIELDHETALKAYEIDDIRSDGPLSPELETFESTRAQIAP